jgi:proteasome lid subunit RPN8/RPN11
MFCIEEDLRAEMKEHAESFPGEEVCGLLYPGRYVRLTNRANERQVRFAADARELARALAMYGEPAAIFHTHPKGPLVPSQADLEQIYYINSTMIVGKIEAGNLQLGLFGSKQRIKVSIP